MDDGHNPAAVTAGPPPAVDPQDPLPESNWKWRRLFVFAAMAARIVGLGIILSMIYMVAKAALAALNSDTANSAKILQQSIDALYNLGWWLIIDGLVDRVLYLIAPSAEQATKMMATVHAWKNGVSTAITSRVATEDSLAETSTLGGPAAAPEVAASAPAPAETPLAAPAAPAAPGAPTEAHPEADLPDYARAS